MAFTDAQVAAYLRDNNINTPAGIAQVKSIFGLDDTQISRAQSLLQSGDASVSQASQDYQTAVSANPELDAQNRAFYDPTKQSGTALQPKTPTAPTPSTFGVQNPNQFLQNYAQGNASSPYTQAAQASALSNLQNAQQAVTANRVNQTTPYGSLSYQQTGVDSQGNPIWSATQSLSPELQSTYQGLLGNLQAQSGQAFNPNLPSVGINPGETYSDAIMRRLQPLQKQQAEGLDVQLANQGIMPGSEAYNRAKTQLSQQQNDQLTSAVVGGFNTGLAANQNAYNQELTKYQLPMATLNQFRAATSPNYVNPSQQATVAGPDYLGAYNAQQNYNIGLQNAQAAQNAGITSGLFGLGGAAIMNPSAVSNAYNTVSGWFS